MPLENELISILLPVKLPADDAKYLGWLIEAIQSVQHQSLSVFELLIIDAPYQGPCNSPSKQTKNLTPLEALLPQSITSDSRIRFLRRTSTGIVSALNTGLDHARGELIARMDADDICDPERLKVQKDFLDQHPAIDIIGAHVTIIASDLKTSTGTRHYLEWLNSVASPAQISANIYIESPLPHPTWMLRRKTAIALGGYRDSEWPEDYDFLLRAHLQNTLMAKPDGVLLKWRDHTQRLTRCDTRYSRKHFLKAKAWALSQSHLLNRPVIILGTGSNATTLHDELVNYGITVRHFVDINKTVKGRTKRQLSVIDYEQLPSIVSESNAIMLSVVTQFGARKKLRNWFDQHGYTELTDFVFVG